MVQGSGGSPTMGGVKHLGRLGYGGLAWLSVTWGDKGSGFRASRWLWPGSSKPSECRFVEWLATKGGPADASSSGMGRPGWER